METGEIGVATASQLQLWSPNGSLLAVSDAPLRGGNAVATLAFAPTPEWLVEQLPVFASGHADGTLRWWVVREPTAALPPPAADALPRALSTVPLGGTLMPSWSLVERPEFRLVGKVGVAVTSLCMSASTGCGRATPSKVRFYCDAAAEAAPLAGAG